MERHCSVCGGRDFADRRVLWPELIREWRLAPEEVAYIDRQQGTICRRCGANLRSIALADALRQFFRTEDTLAGFVRTADAARFRVLEINPAGTLSPVLSRMPRHVLAAYPEADMHALPYEAGQFDVVVHSDTLEHVAHPLRALAECRRLLAPGGALCFTVPVVIGRLSASRQGLPPSYHGNPQEDGEDWAVRTEFGADAWTYPLRVGFREVRINAVDYPAALAITAVG